MLVKIHLSADVERQIISVPTKHCQHHEMGSYSERKPDYGRRLLPQILDDVVSTTPDRIVYSVLNSACGSHQLKHITASAFAKAIDKTAWWLKSLVGAHSTIQPVGYIGPRETASFGHISFPANTLSDDLRHVLLTFAACKAGCTVSTVSKAHWMYMLTACVHLDTVFVSQEQRGRSNRCSRGGKLRCLDRCIRQSAPCIGEGVSQDSPHASLATS